MIQLFQLYIPPLLACTNSVSMLVACDHHVHRDLVWISMWGLLVLLNTVRGRLTLYPTASFFPFKTSYLCYYLLIQYNNKFMPTFDQAPLNPFVSLGTKSG